MPERSGSEARRRREEGKAEKSNSGEEARKLTPLARSGGAKADGGYDF